MSLVNSPVCLCGRHDVPFTLPGRCASCLIDGVLETFGVNDTLLKAYNMIRNEHIVDDTIILKTCLVDRQDGETSLQEPKRSAIYVVIYSRGRTLKLTPEEFISIIPPTSLNQDELISYGISPLLYKYDMSLRKEVDDGSIFPKLIMSRIAEYQLCKIIPTLNPDGSITFKDLTQSGKKKFITLCKEALPSVLASIEKWHELAIEANNRYKYSMLKFIISHKYRTERYDEELSRFAGKESSIKRNMKRFVGGIAGTLAVSLVGIFAVIILGPGSAPFISLLV